MTDDLIMLDVETEEQVVISNKEVVLAISDCKVEKNILKIPKEKALRMAASIIAQVDLL